jgi:hypothetical protein
MRPILLVVVAGVVACAAAPAKPTAQPTATAGSGSGLVCTDEAPTGSTLTRRVCRTPEQIEDERRDAQELLRMQAQRETFNR